MQVLSQPRMKTNRNDENTEGFISCAPTSAAIIRWEITPAQFWAVDCQFLVHETTSATFGLQAIEEDEVT
jgi:hypothetical protein